jgi:hypothetical protein
MHGTDQASRGIGILLQRTRAHRGDAVDRSADYKAATLSGGLTSRGQRGSSKGSVQLEEAQMKSCSEEDDRAGTIADTDEPE